MDLYHLHSSWTHGLEGATMTTFAIKRPLEAMAFWSPMIMKEDLKKGSYLQCSLRWMGNRQESRTYGKYLIL